MIARLLILLCSFALTAGVSFAQSTYPTKPIRVVIPFAAAGSPDIAFRLLTPRLGERLGQPFIIENRPGAAGNIGAAQVATARGDGYTLLYTVNSVICANPHLYSKLPFDALKSFTAVSMVANLGYVLLGRGDLPAANLPELIALAKAQPGKLTYASAGAGGGNHIVMELLNGMAGITMLHVPTRGNATNETLAGQVDMTLSPYTTGVPGAKSGKFRVYGVTLAKRSSQIREVPAIGETLPGFVGDGWHALFAPAGTPSAITERLSAEVRRVLAEPEVRARLLNLSLEPLGTTPAEMTAIVRNDYEKWGKVIRDARIKLD